MKHTSTAKRIASSLTATILALSLLASTSCGFIEWHGFGEQTAESTEPVTDRTTDAPPETTTQPPETTTTPPETTEETTAESVFDPLADAKSKLDSLPSRDLSSSNILIATTEGHTVAPTIDEGEVASDTLTARMIATRAVADKYSTHIISVVNSPSTILEEASKSHAAGMHYADLLAVSQSTVGSLYAAGILANMNSLPFADYDKPYYFDRIIDEAKLGNELRAVMGAASFNPDYLSCIYFNRDIAETLGADIYKLVNDGAWTWDKLNELTTAANALEGIDGYSGIFERSEMLDRAAISMDADFVSHEKGELPYLYYMTDDDMKARVGEIVEKLYRLIYRCDGHFGESTEVFTTGTRLFYLSELSQITELTNESVRWGLLPLPKYDEAQSTYLAPMSDEAPVFCAIASTPDYERPGLVLEALNAASHDYVLDTYMNEMIGFYLRDEGSIRMIETITDGVSTDFVKIFASGIDYLDNATFGAVRSAVTTSASLATVYQSYQSAANGSLNQSTIIYN